MRRPPRRAYPAMPAFTFPRSHALTRALPHAVLGMAVMAGLAAAPLAAHAETAAPAAAAPFFDVPAGPLAGALSRFADQANILLSVPADMAAGKTSPGVHGAQTVEQAFRALLGGTGLEPVRQADGSYSLRRAPAAADTTLPTVSVSGAAVPATTAPYAGGQVARGARIGMLGDKGIMDTPFNVTSYTAQTIANQQATSLADVLNNDPSVRSTWPQGSYTDLFYIRGFPVSSSDVSLDGLYGVLPYQLVNPDFAERVEILKGPSALLNGIPPTGAIGGAINISPKRATDEPIASVTASYASNTQFGTHVDLGRRFGDDNRWGLRFNGTMRGGDTAIDHQHQSLGDAVLGLDYRGDRLRVSADLGYQREHADAPTQPVYLAAGVKVPSAPKGSSNIAAPWSAWRSEDTFGALRAEYDVTPDLTVFAAAGSRENRSSTLATQPTITSSDGAMTNTPYQFPGKFKTRTAQAGVRGSLDTGFVHHDYTVSASTLRQQAYSSLFLASSSIATDLYDPDWGGEPAFPGLSSQRPRVSRTTLSGVAAADTLSVLDERIQLTVGVRKQWIATRSYDRATQAVTAKYDQDAYSPAFGLVVKPIDNVSLYANYIQGLQAGSTAPGTAANAGAVFPPYKSRQYEAGVKVDFGKFTATVSAFQITQPSAITDPSTLVYSVDGRQRNRGLEFNTFGEIASGVRVLGGLTLMDAKLTRTASDATQGKKAMGVPDVQLNLGGEWDLPFIPGLALSARAIYTSSQYADNTNTQKLPDWTRFDVGARYTFTRSNGKPVILRANVLNVTNRNYWAGTSATYGLVRGAPRTVMLSAQFGF
ncbi:TonB-dependent receptor [Bordetella genomosp. 10]|nr:TonB-dependent receptor [Bordetella genomosp. 10]